MEEAPSPLLDEQTRAAMAVSAVTVAQACGYVGAGTVEFIVSADRPDEFFFMEMNTRLQVEHPVTEAVLGVDLVEWQLRVADGEPLPWAGAGPAPRGHAIEARVYAEDARRGFLPASGTVLRLGEPTGLAHVRVDSGLSEGTVVGTEYDPMLAKVIAWGEDRDQAVARLHAALGSTCGARRHDQYRLPAPAPRAPGRAGRRAGHGTGRPRRRRPGRSAPACRGGHGCGVAGRLQARISPGAGADPWLLGDGWRLTGSARRTTRWAVRW